MTDQLERRGVHRGAVAWTVGLGATVAASYAAFLAWDQHKDVDASGHETGPYSSWQVIGCAAVLALLAFEAGRRGRPWLASVVIPAVLTACFSVDAATDADADGLWPIGAVLLAIGSFAGSAAVAHIGRTISRR